MRAPFGALAARVGRALPAPARAGSVWRAGGRRGAVQGAVWARGRAAARAAAAPMCGAVRRVAGAHRGQMPAASRAGRGRSAEHLGRWCGACGRRAAALAHHGGFVGLRTAVGCGAGGAGAVVLAAAECDVPLVAARYQRGGGRAVPRRARQPGHVGRAALRADQGARVSGQRAALLPAAGAPAARHGRQEPAPDGDLCALGAHLPRDGQRRAQRKDGGVLFAGGPRHQQQLPRRHWQRVPGPDQLRLHSGVVLWRQAGRAGEAHAADGVRAGPGRGDGARASAAVSGAAARHTALAAVVHGGWRGGRAPAKGAGEGRRRSMTRAGRAARRACGRQ
ncbi:F-box/LRR-repeat protein [Gracilaria domingensis]|nr:F-box/LRR-repeat protein [Gracilaria domingensis]